MTISTELRKAGPFTGNGVTTAFPFSFKVFAASDVAVTQADTLGAETALVLNSDFTVALNPDQDAAPGGTVTLPAPLSTGYRLIVSSAVPNLQPTDITNNGGFYPQVIEDALDRQVAQIQQIAEQAARAVKVKITDTTDPDQLVADLIADAESARTSAAAAAAAANNAEIAFDSFDDKYLGSKASDPTTDNDGNPPLTGALYWNTSVGAVRVWNGSAWLSMAADASIVDFQQAGTGAVVRTAQDKIREVVSVKDFGAVGDGVTDDTAAIQAAINSLPLNTADAGILTPKGFANGGLIYIPRGRYKVSAKIVLRRGVRICGESRESSQIVSFIGADSVFQYTDSGRYIQDEIVFENLSIWQDASVTATAGAAIDVVEGPASVDSVYLMVDNCLIDGAYRGIRLGVGVGCAVRNSNISRCVLHGVDVMGPPSTTSTVFENTYCHINGGNGFNIARGAYIAFVGCASDSNAGHGYYFSLGSCMSLYGCGAEQNSGAAVVLSQTTGAFVQLFTINNGQGAVQLAAASGTVISGSSLQGSEGAAIRRVTGGQPVILLNNVFIDGYATSRYDFAAGLLDLSGTGMLVGDSQSNRWGIGVIQAPAGDATFNVGGLSGPATTIGLRSDVVHGVAGAQRNVAVWSQFISQNTAVTYPLVIGQFVPDASKGAAATHTRAAGVYVVEQTTGTTANANMLIDAGAGTVPAGNWALFSDSARPSVFKGPVRVGSLGGTAPMVTSGSGTPESVVTAPVGSLYMRTDGGAGTSLYVKQSGTGNTGWAAK